ncbi:hypothetical protein [Myxococcus sp. Y35]|uniref:hypothetical protein n=1 Tax=Pseudomyxococcus flavus TaxID=3115648 RepID=UPI003CEFC27A
MRGAVANTTTCAPEVEAALEALSHGGTNADRSGLLDAGVTLGCTLQLARREGRGSCNEIPAG